MASTSSRDLHPKYVRFALALALASTLALPACSSEAPASSSGAPTQDGSAGEKDAGKAGDASTLDAAVADGSTERDAGSVQDASTSDAATEDSGGGVAGPLPPPEMPV